MNLGIPIAIIIGNRLYQTIKPINNLPVFHYDYADAAGAPDIAIRRLEIYGCKVREIWYYNLTI
jgi:hypothetical protein